MRGQVDPPPHHTAVLGLNSSAANKEGVVNLKTSYDMG